MLGGRHGGVRQICQATVGPNLRLNDDGSPCPGKFDGWPKAVKALKVLDPCMGSGHFLTFALPILARMRVAEEGSLLSEAIAAVLRDNLFGLELSHRLPYERCGF